jgi:hypothetical protein
MGGDEAMFHIRKGTGTHSKTCPTAAEALADFCKPDWAGAPVKVVEADASGRFRYMGQTFEIVAGSSFEDQRKERAAEAARKAAEPKKSAKWKADAKQYGTTFADEEATEIKLFGDLRDLGRMMPSKRR